MTAASWFPNWLITFQVILAVRLTSMTWNGVSDCDETFNYWEPMHFLIYGKGFQTWEYSPQYALRSYTYVLFHTVPAWILQQVLLFACDWQMKRGLLVNTELHDAIKHSLFDCVLCLFFQISSPLPMHIFFFVRSLLALACSAAELYFVTSIRQELGTNVARVTLGILLASSGMFHAGTAFLPSTTSMYLTMLSYGAWLRRNQKLAIFFTAFSAFLSWPFAALLGIPIAIDVLLRKNRWIFFLKWCVISTITILLPQVLIDSAHYGKWVIASMNIVLYNIFTHHGPDLYGKKDGKDPKDEKKIAYSLTLQVPRTGGSTSSMASSTSMSSSSWP